MKIVQVRVDSRLIHGQVASFWTNELGANRIMVIGDHIVDNKMQVKMLQVACPATCKLSVLRLETAKRNLLAQKYENNNVFIIIDDIKVLKELLKTEGINKIINDVNIGNVSVAEGRKAIRKSIYLNREECKILLEISKDNYNVFAQMVPTEERGNFISEVKKCFEEEKWS